MPKPYWILVRGRQRDEVDIDLLAQALLMIAEDLQAEQDQKNKQQESAPPETS